MRSESLKKIVTMKYILMEMSFVTKEESSSLMLTRTFHRSPSITERSPSDAGSNRSPFCMNCRLMEGAEEMYGEVCLFFSFHDRTVSRKIGNPHIRVKAKATGKSTFRIAFPRAITMGEIDKGRERYGY